MAQDLWSVQNAAIQKMDKVCEAYGIEWHKGGQVIRSVMLDAILEGMKYGKAAQRLVDEQSKCEHTFVYDIDGGQCTKCGAESLQDSSD